jgi:hypothetical protein
MKQYTYDELKAEVDRRKKEKSNILGPCCHCNTDVFKDIVHITHSYFDKDQGAVKHKYCCQYCEPYEIEVLVFCAILACVQGTKSWDVFQKLKGINNGTQIL